GSPASAPRRARCPPFGLTPSQPADPATLRGSDPRARVKCYSSRLTAVAGWDDRKAWGCRALTERGHEDCLDRVQAVLGLIEHDAGGGPADLTGAFGPGGQAGVLHALPPDA